MTAKEFVLKDIMAFVEKEYHAIIESELYESLSEYQRGEAGAFATILCMYDDLMEDYGGEAERV